jgi:hypothetical protein
MCRTASGSSRQFPIQKATINSTTSLKEGIVLCLGNSANAKSTQYHSILDVSKARDFFQNQAQIKPSARAFSSTFCTRRCTQRTKMKMSCRVVYFHKGIVVRKSGNIHPGFVLSLVQGAWTRNVKRCILDFPSVVSILM